jgi:hypothetical protein
LMLHSLMAGLSPGLFLERLINEHCRSWRVQANSRGSTVPNDRLDLPGCVSEVEPTAA